MSFCLGCAGSFPCSGQAPARDTQSKERLYQSKNTIFVSSLYQYGLFVQSEAPDGSTGYILSDFGKALKQNSLNFESGLHGRPRIVSYGELAPLNIPEPATAEDIEQMFSSSGIVIDGGTAESGREVP